MRVFSFLNSVLMDLNLIQPSVTKRDKPGKNSCPKASRSSGIVSMSILIAQSCFSKARTKLQLIVTSFEASSLCIHGFSAAGLVAACSETLMGALPPGNWPDWNQGQ